MITNSILDNISEMLTNNGISITDIEKNKPWGGFFVINEGSASVFINTFYPEYSAEYFNQEKISPKILIVMPGKRLSWQYHFRRSELWKLIEGDALISRSETDTECPPISMKINEIVELAKGERHRLIGGNEIGIVAEIWRHTDSHHLSDEADIVRVQDDFGR